MASPQRTSVGRPRVELHVRNHAGYGAYSRQAAVVDRLERLAERGAVDDFSVEQWGKSVELRPDAVGGVHARLDEYQTWAERAGYSLEPAFRRRRVAGAESGETHELLTLPILCLAVYADDELVVVAPCSDGDTVYTVPDALDDLESGTPLRERLSGSAGGRVPTDAPTRG